jgi:allantoinase
VSATELTIHSRHVVTPDGIRDATVRVSGGRIVSVDAGGSATLDLGDLWLLPGAVDTHVHINEPGRTAWEGFASATRAAAAGGITTLVDMPLNSIPATTSLDALETKRAAARGQVTVDCAFWGGVVPGNTAELGPMAAAGVAGFKCFLVPSGVDEFESVGEADLRAAMPVVARLGLPLLVHAEWPGPIERAPRPRDPRRYAEYLATRPRAAEHEALALVLRLVEETRCRVHIVHLASADAVPMLRDAKAAGLPVTVETCPHYLTFEAEEIPDGATAFKCAPPIRERENRERLWEALRQGVVDLVASDHSPCLPELKRAEEGDFMAAWGGIASLELGLAVMATEAGARGFGLDGVAHWMSERPAALAGFRSRKGHIAPGADADLVAWDPDQVRMVDPARLRQRHPMTPYAGRTLRGAVARTFVRGVCVFDRGQFREGAPIGTLLARDP